MLYCLYMLQNVGTRYRFRMVDGKMYSTMVSDGIGRAEPEADLGHPVEVGTKILFVKAKDSLSQIVVKVPAVVAA